jgi:hypothetical protein
MKMSADRPLRFRSSRKGLIPGIAKSFQEFPRTTIGGILQAAHWSRIIDDVMTIFPGAIATALLIALSGMTGLSRPIRAQLPSVSQSEVVGILTRDLAAPIMPAMVFFRGQTASVQARNSAGIRLANGKLFLAALVDTAGYSSALQQSYQAYLLTEVSVTIAGAKLPPGAYGFGFVGDHRLVVMDLGGNEVLQGNTSHDSALARPNPLQVRLGSEPGGYRLYLGRSFVTVVPAEK